MVVLRMLVGSLAVRFPGMAGVVSAIGCADTRAFVGSMYGVSARVEIDMNTRVAKVRLNGLPVGGLVEGRGWFESRTAEEGPVQLEESFAAALRRRRISIVRAALDRSGNTITVVTKVPIIGEATLTLVPEGDGPQHPLCIVVSDDGSDAG